MQIGQCTQVVSRHNNIMPLNGYAHNENNTTAMSRTQLLHVSPNQAPMPPQPHTPPPPPPTFLPPNPNHGSPLITFIPNLNSLIFICLRKSKTLSTTCVKCPMFLLYASGNDCLFTGNYIHDLCYEVTDSGAFYSGRSWISGGNVVANNVFSNIFTKEKVYLGSPSVQAIYLDDQVGGVDGRGNLK